jgi:hypothetical protein
MNGKTILACLTLLAVLPAVSSAQTLQGMTFSIDFQGPTIAVPDSFTGMPIDEGCILTPIPPGPPGPNPPAPGPLRPPGMVVGSTPPKFGTYGRTLNLIPTPLGYMEVDALSYGRDLREVLYFSPDEFAVGIPGSPAPPNVRTEGALGNQEASANVFYYLGRNEWTDFPPVPGFPGNTAAVDGDGVPPFGGPGSGLIEPNPPTVGSYVPPAGPWPDPRDPGDNLDAVDLDTRSADLLGPIYFSLDSEFPDPLETSIPGTGVIGPPPPNTGSAPANGFFPGDVIVNPAPGAGNVLYAPAAALGLDLLGQGTDDLDALILNDRGTLLAFEPLVDFIEFSVRRNSAVIGLPDSRLGIPIEEGDVLTIPSAPGLPPQIVIPAEALGLATVRSGLGMSWGVPNPQWGDQDLWADDLDALDKMVIPEPTTLLIWTLLAGLGAGLGRRRRK